ncbi:hypothetical protein [Marinomonas balearica]|uniref:Phytanoyl-CoA dioxygenase PhyH n=1 Tax=Marinomonas balearica TaxID=491947 RepID=A0A4R6M3W3_9GAMM|nr:hypothetical protein [Marinomonas balearica]TDO95987.1 hypothetical protein DFP79_3357 [Marinomonas balearica]
MNDFFNEMQESSYFMEVDGVDEKTSHSLRKRLRKHLLNSGVSIDGGALQPDLFSYVENVYEAFSSSKVLKELLKDHDVIFCRHADAHLNKGTGWHKDRPEDRFFNEDYNIYKIGIYLQDHTLKKYKDRALSILSGSHKYKELFSESCNVKVINPKAQDILFFDLRATHKGEELSKVEKVMNKFGVLSWLDYIYGRGLRKKEEKLAVFFSVCIFKKGDKKFKFLKDHMAEVSERQNKQNKSEGSDSVLEKNIKGLKEIGFKFYE